VKSWRETRYSSSVDFLSAKGRIYLLERKKQWERGEFGNGISTRLVVGGETAWTDGSEVHPYD